MTWIDMSKLNSRFRQMPLQGIGSNWSTWGVPVGAVAPGSLPYCGRTPNPKVKAFQQAVNRILDTLSYDPIPEDGQLGPQTCGAFTMLGDEKNAGRVSAAAWRTLDVDVIVGMAGSCDGFTMPTKKGSTKPDQLTTVLTPETHALPWRVPTPEARAAQEAVNKELIGHNYLPAPASGMLDAPTCGAFKLVEEEFGVNYLFAYGKNCQEFTPPKKMPPGMGHPPVKSSMMGIGIAAALAGVGYIAYTQIKKRRKR